MHSESDTSDERSTGGEASAGRTRRGVLKAAAATGAVLGSMGIAGATPRSNRGNSGNGGSGGRDGYRGGPPSGITEWGPAVSLGDGSVRTFTSATPSGRPKYQGVFFERAAFSGLPTAGDLEASGDDRYSDKYGTEGLAIPIHHRWSQEFFIPFPRAPKSPIRFLGLNWNPGGHPPDPIWGVPHFDIHFHMKSMAAVDAIEGPRAPDYELPARYIPEGYARPPVVAERVITDMGEHLNDPSDPEFAPGEFDNTLIWGVSDTDGDGTATLNFVEPMITLEYFEDLSGSDRSPIAQPAVYAEGGSYPTSYVVRDVPSSDGLIVAMTDFEYVPGED